MQKFKIILPLTGYYELSIVHLYISIAYNVEYNLLLGRYTRAIKNIYKIQYPMSLILIKKNLMPKKSCIKKQEFKTKNQYIWSHYFFKTNVTGIIFFGNCRVHFLKIQNTM